MGAPRTINHPDIEFREYDLSDYTSTAGGTLSLVMGFFPQGTAGEVIRPTSLATIKNYFGTPESEAERYAYYACKEVMNRNGSLLVARIPYDNDSNNFLPYTEYEIGSLVENNDISAIQNPPLTTEDKTSDYDFSTLTSITSLSGLSSTITSMFKAVHVSGLGAFGTATSEEYQLVSWNGSSISADGTKFVYTSDSAENPLDFAKVSSVSAFTGFSDYKITKYMSTAASSDSLTKRLFGFDIPELSGKTQAQYVTRYETDGYTEVSSVELWKSGNLSSLTNNHIAIVNTTNKVLGADKFNNDGEEVLGIGTILYSGVNGAILQRSVTVPSSVPAPLALQCVGAIVRAGSDDKGGQTFSKLQLNQDGFVQTLASTSGYSVSDGTVSNQMAGYFDPIPSDDSGNPDGSRLNEIGIAVVEFVISRSNNNKVAVNLLENWVGSLDRTAKADDGKTSMFIDNIVNAGSNYINVFSKWVKPESYNIGKSLVAVLPAKPDAANWFLRPTVVNSIGFVSNQVKKFISYSTIAKTLDTVFDSLANIDETEIDVVVDAGLSNIANTVKYMKDQQVDAGSGTTAIGDGLGAYLYDPSYYFKIGDVSDVAAWKTICAKLLTFCSSTRKDCMAVIDAPRNVALKGKSKLVYKGSKTSVDIDILPQLKYIGGLNNNYGAGYLTWMTMVDDFSGDTFWYPESIAADGCIIYTDTNANYWNAPAGSNRGVISNAVDVAFNPTKAQQDVIYPKAWNYATYTTADGITIQGQKTLQTRTSAMDRINVRRLFLKLERLTRKTVKPYLYEQNTEALRNKVIDRTTPIYENVKTMGGLYDYELICDSRNNTALTIDNNELRFAALLKPSKTIEFIILDFYALSTGAAFSEAYGNL
jgi:hypothetical protein